MKRAQKCALAIAMVLPVFLSAQQSDPTINESTFKIGGNLAVNYANQNWTLPELGHQRGISFDNLALTFDGVYKNRMVASAEYRFYGFTSTLKHAWVGFRPNEFHQIEVGITQVPFGVLPVLSGSYWSSLGLYLGMEDDYDAGIKWSYSKNNWDMHLAYFQNEEYGDASNLTRYSTDLVLTENSFDKEIAQGNVRIAYVMGRDSDSRSEFGVSGEYGGINNTLVEESGHHWQAAVHYIGNYGSWSPSVQVARYEYHTVNEDSFVVMGALNSVRPVAAQGTMVGAGLTKHIDLDLFIFKGLTAYYYYSGVYKDEEAYDDSQLHNLGCSLESGNFTIYIDMLLAKSAWYFDDSFENSGPGAGNGDAYRYIGNVSINWNF